MCGGEAESGVKGNQVVVRAVRVVSGGDTDGGSGGRTERRGGGDRQDRD